MLKTTNTHQR